MNSVKFRYDADAQVATTNLQKLLAQIQKLPAAQRMAREEYRQMHRDLMRGLSLGNLSALERQLDQVTRAAGRARVALSSGVQISATTSAQRQRAAISRSISTQPNAGRLAVDRELARAMALDGQELAEYQAYRTRRGDLRRAMSMTGDGDASTRDYLNREMRMLQTPELQRLRAERAAILRQRRQTQNQAMAGVRQAAEIGRVIDPDFARVARARGFDLSTPENARAAIRAILSADQLPRGQRREMSRTRGRTLLADLPESAQLTVGRAVRDPRYLAEAEEAGVEISDAEAARRFRRRSVQERWNQSRARNELSQRGLEGLLSDRSRAFAANAGIDIAPFRQAVMRGERERVAQMADAITQLRLHTDRRMMNLIQTASTGQDIPLGTAQQIRSLEDRRQRTGRFGFMERRRIDRELGELALQGVAMDIRSDVVRAAGGLGNLGRAAGEGTPIRSVGEAAEYRSQAFRDRLRRVDRVAAPLGMFGVGAAYAGMNIANKYSEFMAESAQRLSLLEDETVSIVGVNDNATRGSRIRSDVLSGGIASLSGTRGYAEARRDLESLASDITPQEVQTTLDEAAKLFRIQRANMSFTAKAITAIRKLAPEDFAPGDQGIRQAADKLVYMADVGGANLNEMAPYLVNIVGAFKGMGYTADEAFAATAVASQSGMRPELFTTAIRNIPLVLADAEKKTGQELMGKSFGEVIEAFSTMDGATLLEITGRDPYGTAKFLASQRPAYERILGEVSSRTGLSSYTGQKMADRLASDPKAAVLDALKASQLVDDTLSAELFNTPDGLAELLRTSFREQGAKVSHGKLGSATGVSWVAKNLFQLKDEMGLEPGRNDPMRLGLLATYNSAVRGNNTEMTDFLEMMFGPELGPGMEVATSDGGTRRTDGLDYSRFLDKKKDFGWLRAGQYRQYLTLEARDAGAGDRFLAELDERRPPTDTGAIARQQAEARRRAEADRFRRQIEESDARESMMPSFLADLMEQDRSTMGMRRGSAFEQARAGFVESYQQRINFMEGSKTLREKNGVLVEQKFDETERSELKKMLDEMPMDVLRREAAIARPQLDDEILKRDSEWDALRDSGRGNTVDGALARSRYDEARSLVERAGGYITRDGKIAGDVDDLERVEILRKLQGEGGGSGAAGDLGRVTAALEQLVLELRAQRQSGGATAVSSTQPNDDPRVGPTTQPVAFRGRPPSIRDFYPSGDAHIVMG